MTAGMCFTSPFPCDIVATMKSILQHLVQLQSIEFSETENENDAAIVCQLRSQIPAQILGHYDRLVARGKKGIALVRRQTCTACHMKIPLGDVLTLRRDDDIVLCESCGRYLCLDETSDPLPPAKKKPSRRKAAPLLAA